MLKNFPYLCGLSSLFNSNGANIVYLFFYHLFIYNILIFVRVLSFLQKTVTFLIFFYSFSFPQKKERDCIPFFHLYIKVFITSAGE